MRYKSCTSDDIEFLCCHVTGTKPGAPKLAQKRFRNIAIITAWNSQNDKINELGSKRFARETGQKLTTFYCIDKWKCKDSNKKKKRGKRKKFDPARTSENVEEDIQNILWEQPHGTSDNHIPAKLSLCVGLPIMIRNNNATECCITMGAEATVASWQSSIGLFGQNVLDTLFVKLKNPLKPIKIDGLPKNVVPIIRRPMATQCLLPNDDLVSLTRDQVPVLPNFAMTDYASQGHTRPDNPINLNSCRDHLSYYTCLSRSATAKGTIIVQLFCESTITGGCMNVYLQQEFRELELLNEITRLRYNSWLPEAVTGCQCNEMIHTYRQALGSQYIPLTVHRAIQWSPSEIHTIPPPMSYIKWRVVSTKSETKQ